MASISDPAPVKQAADNTNAGAPASPPFPLEESNNVSPKVDENNSQQASRPDSVALYPDQIDSYTYSPTDSAISHQPVLAPTDGIDDNVQKSFVLSELKGDSGAGEFDLPPEISNADLSIAADGSFVQTTSGLAAQMLKKSYDKMLGVGQVEEGGQGVVRSPYAISALQGEFGNTVYRISRRQPNVVTEDGAVSDTLYGHTTGSRRKTRLSVQDFLPAAMFKPTNEGTRTLIGSTPPASATATSPQARRKLRKTRSNSDLQLKIGSGPSQDAVAHLSPPAHFETFSLEIRDELTAGADAFSQVLGWTSELVSDRTPSTRKTSKASMLALEDIQNQNKQDTSAPVSANGTAPRRPSVSTSAALSAVGETSNPPFGEGVRFTAPLRQFSVLLEPLQHQLREPQLREMQSFESGLTAKIGDEQMTSPGTPRAKKGEEDIGSVQNHARFSTKVFDVLQTYRGLPLPSALSSAPPTGATIKMSTTDSANPKDDPRFVIWGEVLPEGTTVDDSKSSHTDLSNSVGGLPPRKRSNARAPDASQVSLHSDKTVQTVIIAATIERWIAQLTSELNYEELLNFLLTYRTYISSTDLCHLLICRFHWALEVPSSKQDEMVRRIIRVRTFIAIRYWILTFFREDFLPDPLLCRLFTTWLNTLSKDPHLKKHADALSIVRKLKKIVRDCKAAHPHNGRPVPMSTNEAVYPNVNGALGDLGSQNKKSTEAELDDADVDLDLSWSINTNFDTVSGKGTMGQPIVFGEEYNRVSLNSSSSSSGFVPSQASPDAILLSQPLSKAILGHLKSTNPGIEPSGPATLPVQHSAISRAFVNTMGRLGRWRRVLNSRPGVVVNPPGAGISAFQLDVHSKGDLLPVAGGVEEYLKMLNMRNSALHSAMSSQTVARPHPETEKTLVSVHSSSHSGINDEVSTYDTHGSLISTDITDDSISLHTDAPSQPEWTPEIVSLDEYDLSDSDSSPQSPVQTRKLPKRLPLRRDFQFVRRSVESASSMGIQSRSSMASSVRSGSPGTHDSRESELESGAVTGGRQRANIVLEWPPVDFSDDEDEAGDAEAALRRLEGQIDMVRQREKEIKIGRWLESAARRSGPDPEPGNRDSISSLLSNGETSETSEDDMEDRQSSQVVDEDNTISVQTSSASHPTDLHGSDHTSPTASTAIADILQSSDRQRPASISSSQVHFQSASRPTSADARRPSLLSSGPRITPNLHLSSPPSHQSFILMFRSETLAQQFTIIEAELFTRIKFEELISHQWGQALEDVDVKDWVQFVKERAKLKNAAKIPLDPLISSKLSAILALRARFDLLVNFIASEVLQTHSAERVALVAKFIRLAWKLYLQNNFGTLVAVIAGLQTRWVNQAMFSLWSKVGIWEQRVFDDLKRFTSRAGEFRFIREATAALVDARPLQATAQDSSSSLSGTASSSTKPGSRVVSCVPFLGAYLAQLYGYEKLPDYIDPTAPSEPVLINHETGTLSVPSQPEIFFTLQPLPEDLTLEPLVNVHKQRLIADVIKFFVGGQHLATKIPYSVDQKGYQKCFRLRSLSPDALQSTLTASSRSRRNVA